MGGLVSVFGETTGRMLAWVLQKAESLQMLIATNRQYRKLIHVLIEFPEKRLLFTPLREQE